MSHFQCPVLSGDADHSLKEAPHGKPLIVSGVHADAATSRRLREMGFCESASIEKLSQGSCVLCKVCGVSVALGADVAAKIMVTQDLHEPERSQPRG